MSYTEWKKQNEGYYEYGVFDGDGDLVGNVWRSKELAEITCRERKAGNPGRDYCVKKRLVMAWEVAEEDG